MKNNKKYIVGLCSMLVIISAVYAILKAQNANDMIDSKSARTILESYSRILENVDVQKLGMPAAADVKEATLTNPYHVSIIPLDKLKAMSKDTGNTIETAVTPTNTSYYEIHGKSGAAMGLVEVEKKDGQYVAISFGNKGLADAITRLKAQNPQYATQAGAIVRVLAFHLELWRVQAPSGYVFIPMQSIPALRIEEGAPLSGKEMFNKVKSFADNYNGLPM